MITDKRVEFHKKRMDYYNRHVCSLYEGELAHVGFSYAMEYIKELEESIQEVRGECSLCNGQEKPTVFIDCYGLTLCDDCINATFRNIPLCDIEYRK